MNNDALIKNEGIKILIDKMGIVETEKFIMLIQKEKFDYTKWQENLFQNMTIDEIFNNAANMRKKATN